MEYLREALAPDVGVAAIYCEYKEGAIQSPAHLLAGLWRQLVVDRPLSDTAKDLYRKHREPATRPSVREVMEVLKLETSREPRSEVFIVVDALDECLEDNNIRQILLTELRAIQPRTHLMITSRPHVDITSDFPESIQLEIRATDDDVRCYIDARMAGDRDLAMLLKGHTSLQNKMREVVADNASGMYV